jgi:zinc protease
MPQTRIGAAAPLLATTLILAPLTTAHAQGTSPLPPLTAYKELNLPKVVEKTLPNGLRLVLLEDHTQPAVWMRLVMPAGTVRDPAGKPGVVNAVAGLLDAGTRTRTQAQISSTVDGLGASLSAGADEDYLSVSANCLSPYTEKLFDLLSDITLNPAFAQDELDRYKVRTQSELQATMGDPGTVAGAALARLVYGTHPYGNLSLGTGSSISSLTTDDLKKLHQTYFAPNASILFLAGDISEKQAEALATKYLGAWAKRDVPAPPAAPKPVAGDGKSRVIIVDRPASEQTEVRIGGLTDGFDTPKRMTGLVATAVLGMGQFDSRLTREIRVKRGLTYGASSGFARNQSAGEFTISTFTKNASTGEVVKIALDEVKKLRDTPPPADELADRKTFLKGSYVVSTATPQGLLGALVAPYLYGKGIEELKLRATRIDAVKPEEVRAILAEVPATANIVLVGDAKAIQPQVADLGTVTVIPQAELDLSSPTLTAPAQAAAPPAAAGDVAAGKELLAQAVKAHGGDAFLKLKSLTFKGKGVLTQAGSDIPLDAVTFQTSPPDKSLMTMTTPFGPVLAGTPGGGKSGWLNLGGQIQEQAGFPSVPLYLLVQASRGELNVAALPATPVVKSVDGKELKGFTITPDKGRPTRVFIDPETGLIRRAEITAATGSTVLNIGSYKEVAGVKLPGTFEIVLNGQPLLSLIFDSIDATTPVADSVFEKPAAK